MLAQASELRSVTSAQVCLILGLSLIGAATVVGLAALGKDVVTILTGVGAITLAIAGAFGWTKAQQLTRGISQVNTNVDHVKEISNGRLTEALDEVKSLNVQLAQAMLRTPPPEDR